MSEQQAYGRGTGSAHPVDIQVGKRVRTRRLLLRINQETLADRLGLTFQQVQKYESGANRISASRLHAIAEVLNVSISWFFDGVTMTLPGPDWTNDPKMLELVRVYYAIPDTKVRAAFLSMVKAISHR